MTIKTRLIWLLYAILAIYGCLAIWLLYVGPVTTQVVRDKITKNNIRIVASLTTTPYRIDKIKATLDSILDQSILPHMIYLHIPWQLERANIAYELPEWLVNYQGISIVRTNDYGPITKLIPTLNLESDPNTIIVTFDDDIWYPRHVVRDLTNFMLSAVNTAATPVNIQFDLDAQLNLMHIKYRFKHASKARLVVGACGVAYRRGFFQDDIYKLLQLPQPCNLADDLLISLYLSTHNIAVSQVAEKSLHPLVIPFTYKELPYRFGPDALSFAGDNYSGHIQNYSACLKKLAALNSQFLSREWVLGAH